MLFNNLDIKLDVVQHELGIPAAFQFTRGFIKELRVHIPWSSITTKPVEITFTGVECVLSFVGHASSGSTHNTESSDQQSSYYYVDAPPPTPTPLPTAVPYESSGGWATDLITKIIANLTVTVNDLSVHYHEGCVSAALHLSSAQLYSSDPSWRSRAFMDLLGPWKLAHKVLSIESTILYMRIHNTHKEKEEQTDINIIKQENCILSSLSISVRIKSYLAALGAAADTTGWTTQTTAYHPSTDTTNGVQQQPRPLPPACGAAITMDIHVVSAIDLFVTPLHLLHLHSIIQSKSNFYATTAAAARMAQTIAAVPAVIVQHTEEALMTKAESTQHTTQVNTISITPKTGRQGWISRIWAYVAGEDDDHRSKQQDASVTTSANTLSDRDGDVFVLEGAVEAASSLNDNDGTEDDDSVSALPVSLSHLSPTEEIIFCIHIPSIAIHLLTPDALSAASFTPPSFASVHEHHTHSHTHTVSPPAHPVFASLVLSELGMVLSQPVSLSRSSSPSSNTNPSTTSSTRPPTLCFNIVSVSMSVFHTKSESSAPSPAGHAVLKIGPYPWIRPTVTVHNNQPTEITASSSTAAQSRVNPFTQSPCLHRNKYWEYVAASQKEHQIHAVSFYHTVSQSVSSAVPFASPSAAYHAVVDLLVGSCSLSIDLSVKRLVDQVFQLFTPSSFQRALLLSQSLRNAANSFDDSPDEISPNDLLYTALMSSDASSDVWCGMYQQHTDVCIQTFRSFVYNDKDTENYTQGQTEFIQEVRHMSRLRHPQLVLFLGVCSRVSTSLSIVTELLDCSLFHLLHNTAQQLDERQRIQIALDVARGMLYLHLHKPHPVIHKQLTSSAVMVDKHRSAKIAAAGMNTPKAVNIAHSLQQTSRTVNNDNPPAVSAVSNCPPLWQWMSPELLSASAVNEKTDVYSFGIILCELITRCVPYAELDAEAAEVAWSVIHSKQRPALPSKCPAAYSQLVGACTETNSAARPSFSQIVDTLTSFIRNNEESQGS